MMRMRTVVVLALQGLGVPSRRVPILARRSLMQGAGVQPCAASAAAAARKKRRRMATISNSSNSSNSNSNSSSNSTSATSAPHGTHQQQPFHYNHNHHNHHSHQNNDNSNNNGTIRSHGGQGARHSRHCRRPDPPFRHSYVSTTVVDTAERRPAGTRAHRHLAPSTPMVPPGPDPRGTRFWPLRGDPHGPATCQTRYLHLAVPCCASASGETTMDKRTQGAAANADVAAGAETEQQDGDIKGKHVKALRGGKVSSNTPVAKRTGSSRPAEHIAISSDPDAVRLRAEAVLAGRTHLSPGQLRHLFIQMEALPHYRLMLRIVTQQMQQGKEVCAKLWQSILASMGTFAGAQDLEQVLKLTRDLDVWPGDTPPPAVLLARVQSYFNAGDQAQAMRVLQDHVECDHLFQWRFMFVDLLRGRVRGDDFGAIRAITDAYPQHVSLMCLASLARLALERRNEPLAARALMLRQGDSCPVAIPPEPHHPIKNLCRLVLLGLVARSNKSIAVQFYRWCVDSKVRVAPALARSLMTMVADFGDVPRACHVMASVFIADRKIPGDFVDLLVRAYANASADASADAAGPAASGSVEEAPSSSCTGGGTNDGRSGVSGNGDESHSGGCTPAASADGGLGSDSDGGGDRGDDDDDDATLDDGERAIYWEHASGSAQQTATRGQKEGETVGADLGAVGSLGAILNAQDEVAVVKGYLMAGKQGLRRRDARKIASEFKHRWARHQSKTATRKEQQMDSKWSKRPSAAPAMA